MANYPYDLDGHDCRVVERHRFGWYIEWEYEHVDRLGITRTLMRHAFGPYWTERGARRAATRAGGRIIDYEIVIGDPPGQPPPTVHATFPVSPENFHWNEWGGDG